MAYNKIIYGGNTLIDLTQDDVTAADVLAGKNYHGRDGEATTGAMNNRGAVSGTISTKAGVYTIASGYHNGSGTVQISSTEQAKIITGNIKHGVSILGVTGNYNGDGVNLQSKTASFTPSASAQSQTVTADTGYDGLQQVAITVAAIPYVETANTYGTTVTIG
jgi:hypothetical protein